MKPKLVDPDLLPAIDKSLNTSFAKEHYLEIGFFLVVLSMVVIRCIEIIPAFKQDKLLQ